MKILRLNLHPYRVLFAQQAHRAKNQVAEIEQTIALKIILVKVIDTRDFRRALGLACFFHITLALGACEHSLGKFSILVWREKLILCARDSGEDSCEMRRRLVEILVMIKAE